MSIVLDGTTGITTPGETVSGTGVWSVGGTQLYKDASGNLGVGVTPSAWGGGLKAIEIGGSNGYLALNNTSASGYVYWNMFNDGSNNKTKITGSIGAYGFSVSGSHVWFNGSGTTGTTSSLTQAMTLDSSGNLGVGTSSPAFKIQTTTTATSNFVSVVSGTTATSGLLLGDTDSATVGRVEYENSNNAMTLFTNGSERVRIDSSGNLLVGTTTANRKLTVNGGISASGSGDLCAIDNLDSISGAGYGLQIHRANADGNALYFLRGGSYKGAVVVSTGGTSYNTSSDYRLKENITPMTGALDKVTQLKPVTYNWKADGSEGQGFIAHELQEVVPDCVTGEKDAVDSEGNAVYQGIDTSFLVATLTAAIQEQQALITSLTERITALEGA